MSWAETISCLPGICDVDESKIQDAVPDRIIWRASIFHGDAGPGMRRQPFAIVGSQCPTWRLVCVCRSALSMWCSIAGRQTDEVSQYAFDLLDGGIGFGSVNFAAHAFTRMNYARRRGIKAVRSAGRLAGLVGR